MEHSRQGDDMGKSWEVEVREVNSLFGKCWKVTESTAQSPTFELTSSYHPLSQDHQTHCSLCKSYANLSPPIHPAAPRGVGNILVWVLPFINF